MLLLSFKNELRGARKRFFTSRFMVVVKHQKNLLNKDQGLNIE